MQNRRAFLRNTAAFTAGSFLLPKTILADPYKALPAPGLQLFTLFNVLDNDVSGNLKQIAAIGYKEIESAFSRKGGYYGMSAKEFAAMVKDTGMHWRSHHVMGAPYKPRPGAKPPTDANGNPIVIPPMKNLRDNMQEMVDQAAEGGISYLVCASIPIGTLDEVKSAVDILNKTGEAAKKAGVQFAYHNHEREFASVEGVVPYDLFLSQTDSNNVKMELDLAWAMKGGQDPVALFKKNPGRFHLWHVKDADKEYKQVLEVGQGFIDFKRIFEHADISGMKYYFVEQDGAPEPLKNIATSIQHLKNTVLK